MHLCVMQLFLILMIMNDVEHRNIYVWDLGEDQSICSVSKFELSNTLIAVGSRFDLPFNFNVFRSLA
jgi:hypothetical protein